MAWLSLVVLILPFAATARTWYVTPDGSGDAPTIQAAIDSSVTGDSVVVAAGTYDENLVIPDEKQVVLRGEDGAEDTVVDAGQRDRVLAVYGGGVVEGLTLRNGKSDFGGGVLVQRSQGVVIRENIIEDNHVGVFDFGDGGGIYLYFDTNGAIIESNTIRNNLANDSGGGIFERGSNSPPHIIRDNLIVDNEANLSGGGVSMANGMLMNNVIANNMCGVVSGGGVILRPDASGSVVGNTIVGNFAIGSRPTGMGIRVSGNSRVTHNLVAYNRHPSTVLRVGLGIDCWGSGSPTIECNDTWGNDIDEIDCETLGVGNFSEDPLFCAVDPLTTLNFLLQEGSPCAPGSDPRGGSCGQIGARPIGCTGVGVQELMWTQVKELYR